MNVEDVMPVAEMPRTVEELRAFTRFRLKAMMRKAGMLDEAATEAAIVSLPIGAMAERLAEHLAHLDGGKMPAKAAPAAPAAAAPAPIMAPPPAPAPEVTEAPAPPKRGRPAKNPRPPTEAAPAQTAAPSVPPPPPAPAPMQAPTYSTADYSGQFEKVYTEIAALRTLVTSMRAEVLNTIAASNSHAGSCGHEVKAKLDVIQEMAKFSQALSLFFAEETLGGGREEIVKAAVGDAEAIDNMVGKARGR